MELLEERQTRGFSRRELPAGVDRRIEYLDGLDRKLLELTVRGRLTRYEAGLLTGLATGSVTRRIRHTLRRLHDPLAVALVDSGKLLPELHQEVGLAHFLRNRSVREIGRDFGLSVHCVRRMLLFVRGWFEAIGR